MDAESRARSRAEVVDEVSKWGVGGGILLMALFPLALPILILTLVALVPLALPVVAVALVAGVVALPVILIRKLSSSVRKFRRPRRRRRPPEPAPRQAAEV
jgi:hypothetical protein